MSKNSLKLKIAHLYPDILQGFCDDFNVETFCARAKWRNIEITLNKVCMNERIPATKYDFYYIGGTNTTNLKFALKYLKQNEDSLQTAAMAKIPMLAINCGYILFQKEYQPRNSAMLKGLGIFNIFSNAGKDYGYGYINGTCSFLEDTIVTGFENHSISTYFKDETKPFLTLNKGFGNNGQDKIEGARIYNVVGTNIISPILAQNPLLCDFLISQALKTKYKCTIPLEELYDDVEFYSHNYIIETK